MMDDMCDLATHYLEEARRQMRGHKLRRLRGPFYSLAVLGCSGQAAN